MKTDAQMEVERALVDLAEHGYDARTDVLLRTPTGHTFEPEGRAREIYERAAYSFLRDLRWGLLEDAIADGERELSTIIEDEKEDEQ